jgi:hypothetical protein
VVALLFVVRIDCGQRNARSPYKGVPAVITASELIPNLATVTGFPEATVRGHYRKLSEAGLLPLSRGSTVEKLNTRHTVMLLLSLLVDVPAKDAAAWARAYYALADEDGNKIGDALVNILNSFRSVNDTATLAFKSRVEIDCSAPRACIISECTEGSIETLFGIRDKQWSDVQVRRSMTISGKVLFDLAIGIHFNRWDQNDSATKEHAE